MMISLVLSQLFIQPGAEDQSELALTSYFCHRCDWLFSASYETKTCGEDCYYLTLFMCWIQSPLPNNISSREMETWGGEDQSQTKSERKSQEQKHVSQPVFIKIAHVAFPVWNQNERLPGKNGGSSGLFVRHQKLPSLWSPGWCNSSMKNRQHLPVGHPLYVKLPFHFSEEHSCESRCAGQVDLEAHKRGSDKYWVPSIPLNILAWIPEVFYILNKMYSSLENIFYRNLLNILSSTWNILLSSNPKVRMDS